MRRLTKALVILAVMATLAISPDPVAVAEAHPTQDTSMVTGQGAKLDRAICIGCAITVVAAGGATWGGLAFLAGLYPEPILACGFMCVVAFAT